MPKERSKHLLRNALATPALKLQSDERLVALARDGHEAAFEAIVERYQRPLTSYCRRLLGPDLAQDAVQQTFATAYAQLIEGAGPVHLRAWLYRVAGNLSISMLRRRYTDHQELSASIPAAARDAEPAERVERAEQMTRLLDRLHGLPQRERDALLLKEMEGRPFEEIAQMLNATPKGAKQLAYRARQRLRNALGALLPVPLLLWLLRGGQGWGVPKGAIVAVKTVKQGTAIKLAAAVFVSAGAAYGVNAVGHKDSPHDAAAQAPRATQSSPSDSTLNVEQAGRAARRHAVDRRPLSPSGGPAPTGPGGPGGPGGNGNGGAREPAPDPEDPEPPPGPPPGEPGKDTTPPVTTIDSGPNGTTSDATPTFTFNSSEPNSTFECRRSAGAWMPCDSPHTISIGYGAHHFGVRATDAAGNTDPNGASRTIEWAPAPGPSWSSATALSPGAGGTSVGRPDMATNQAGDAVAVWTQNNEGVNLLFAAVKRAGEAFGHAQPVPMANTTHHPAEPEVAIDPDGNVTLVWQQYDSGHQSVWASTNRGHSFNTLARVSGATVDASSPQIAVDDGGKAIAVWTEGTATMGVWASIQPANGTFGGSTMLTDQGEISHDPQVAFDGHGEAVVAWTAISDGNPVTRATSRSAGGTYGEAQTLSGAEREAGEVGVVTDATDNAIVYWRSQADSGSRIEVSSRPLDGDFGASETISSPQEFAGNPHVAVDDQGSAMAVWSSGRDTDAIAGIRTSLRPAGGQFGSPATVPGSGEGASEPKVVFDSDGNATAAWTNLWDGEGRSDARVVAARKPVDDDSFSAGALVSGSSYQSYMPSLGAGQAGLTAIWVEDRNGPTAIETADQL